MNLPGALGRRSRGRRVSQAADRSGEPSPFQSRYSNITVFGMLQQCPLHGSMTKSEVTQKRAHNSYKR